MFLLLLEVVFDFLCEYWYKETHLPNKSLMCNKKSHGSWVVLRRKQFIRDGNYYIQWLLLLFLVVFSASLSGRDDFDLFDSLDENSVLFANALCDIPILRHR